MLLPLVCGSIEPLEAGTEAKGTKSNYGTAYHVLFSLCEGCDVEPSHGHIDIDVLLFVLRVFLSWQILFLPVPSPKLVDGGSGFEI